MHRFRCRISFRFIAIQVLLVAIFMASSSGNILAQTGNTLSIGDVSVLPLQQTDVSIVLAQTEGTVYSFDLTITYDPSVVSYDSAENGGATDGWFRSINSTTPGMLLIGMAGGSGLTTGGEILVLTFKARLRPIDAAYLDSRRVE